MATGYKVVCWNRAKYFSVIMCVEYQINKATERPKDCGPLALFSRIEAALNFKRDMDLGTFNEENHVFECEYTPSKDNLLWMVTDYSELRELSVEKLPPGTIFADSITLLKRVY